MTFSYSLLTLSTTPKDQIRLLIYDTDPAAPLLADEEIIYLQTVWLGNYGAAGACCRALQAKFSRLADTTVGAVKVMHSQNSRNYMELALRYENLARTSGAMGMYAGAISQTDKGLQSADQDRVNPQYALGMEDNYLPLPGSGNPLVEPSP